MTEGECERVEEKTAVYHREKRAVWVKELEKHTGTFNCHATVLIHT